GVGLAVGLIRLMGAFGMHLDAAEIAVEWTVPVAAYAVGTGVTFVAAYLPARRAARVSPMAALADAEVAGVGRPLRVRAAVGLTVGAAGAAALAGCARSTDTGDAAALLAAGIAGTLVAVVVAGPLLVRPVIRVLGAAFPRLFGPVGRMSRRNALRNPRRTGATASALMVGLALVVGMSVAAASVTASFDEEIDRTLGADFVVQNDAFTPFPQEITEKVRETDGVATLVRQRFAQMRVTLPEGDTVKKVALASDPGLSRVSSADYARGGLEASLRPGRVSVARGFAEARGLRLGSRLTATFPGGARATLTVAGISEEAAGGGGGVGDLLIGMATLDAAQPGGQDAALLVAGSPGADAGRLRTALERTLDPYPQVKALDRADYKELVRDQVAVLLYLLFALVGLAIVIAVLGVVNTLALSVIERTREIGLLRAIGLARRQLRRMIRLESVVIAVCGSVLGLGLGLVWGVTAHEVLALEGMTALGIPWWTVAGVVAGSALIGLLAALLPALRASRMDVLSAIAHE
ncbi:FtsX-like permease family protein, partial [Streptomyces boncukensis]